MKSSKSVATSYDVLHADYPKWAGRGEFDQCPTHQRAEWLAGSYYTLKISAYRFLTASPSARMPSGSSFISLMSASLRLPGFSTVCECAEYCRASSTISCWASRECIQFWNRRAAFGLGAPLKTALGAGASGVRACADTCEGAARSGGERRALLGINYFDRLTCLLVADDEVAGAVHHDRAFPEGNPLRRVGRRLGLHDAL